MHDFEPIFETVDRPPLIAHLVCALFFSMTSTVLLFPAIQYSSMYVDSVQSSSSSAAKYILSLSIFGSIFKGEDNSGSSFTPPSSCH